MVELDTVLIPAPTCVGEACADDFLVLDTDGGRYFGLGEVGGFVWGLLDGHHDLRFVAEAMVARYGIALDRATVDLCDLVAQMLEYGLVVDTG